MTTIFRLRLIALLCTLALVSPAVRASEFASGQLNIAGLALEVLKPNDTGADIPGIIETKFGGQQGDAAPATDMIAAGDLTGPALDAPITIKTQPGRAFTLPPLHDQGTYTLANIRLLDKNGNFVQPASPASVTIQVVGTLSSSVTVTQLTPDDLRARGINIDSTNYDSYDYNFVFTVNGQQVQVPYTVIVDKRTHEIIQPPAASPYQLPTPVGPGAPPRFQPPMVFGVPLTEDLDSSDSGPEQQAPDLDSDPHHRRPTIPAAIVLPTGFGVLHQFFAVILNVTNAAPSGSTIKLDGVTATFTAPNGMRIAKVIPAVAIGQPVPIYDSATGATFLVAAAQGGAEWSLEALRTGTQTVDVDIRATYQQDKQPDVALKGHVSASISVSDPRFQINFVHPDTVRAGEAYTAYAFVTNISNAAQTVKLDLSTITSCEAYVNNICRVDGDAIINATIAPGATQVVPYHLKTKSTGRVSSAVLDAPDGVTGSVTLAMGVDTNGIPLSPATIVMPYYAQFVDSSFVQSQMPLIGIAYSLATAPTVPSLSSFPRLITTDVFTRAQNIARAGQRIFVARANASTDDPAEDRDPIFHLALDLLGNVERIDRLAVTPDMHEWDQVREKISDGRTADAAMARELERVGLAGGKQMHDFVDDFAAATSHRAPYFLALVHGQPVSGNARPYALTVTGSTSHGALLVPAEASANAITLPFGQLTRFTSSSEAGELAIVGRWQESLALSIVAASPNFTIDLIYPDAANGAFIRSTLSISGAVAGTPVTLTVGRGNRALVVSGASAAPSASTVAETPLTVVHAAQDLHLDATGHIVTVLFNRPVQSGDVSALRDLVTLQTSVPSAGVTVTKKNNPLDATKPVVIPGASIQDDNRLLNISFDHALSTNAQYRIGLAPFTDALVPGMTYASDPPAIVPRVDNNAPGGVVVGTVIKGDNSPLKSAMVQLEGSGGQQFDFTADDGTFLFEFVHRDIDLGFPGTYSLSVADGDKRASLDGAIRTAGEVQKVVLQFLGRGSATGHARYSDGTPIANAPVTVGSTLYINEWHRGTTDANGLYAIADLPVGPLTFAVVDAKGNVSYAANQIRTSGEVVTQDLVIEKKDFAGLASVRVTVKRDDTMAVVAGAHVGVSTQGYGLVDGFTNSNGQFTFTNVPAGFVSVLASEFGIAPQSIGVDFDLKADTFVDQQLLLHIPTANDSIATVSGNVTRDDPAQPSLSNSYPVPGARVTIGHLAPVIADGNGHYVVTGVPTSLAGQKAAAAYDPATGRGAFATLPAQLHTDSENDLPIRMLTTVAQGTATLKVILNAASGEPVTDYHVIWPGYPFTIFDHPAGTNVYTLTVKVPQTVDVWALPALPEGSHPVYGDQTAHATMRADFDGQVVQVNLRLPGQGSVLARILTLNRCPDGQQTCPPTYSTASGMVGMSYLKWSQTEQSLVEQDLPPAQTDPNTGYATFTKVPVGQATVETIDNTSGYASASPYVGYEGDQQKVDLTLSTSASVTGRVLNYDGQTPIANAEVRLYGTIANGGPFYSAADGTFRFPSVAVAQGVHLVATVDQNGVHREGFVDGGVPASGGPVGNLTILMRQQANVDGDIVDANGTPIPLARYWVRELAWPYRTFGSSTDPLFADKNGHFFMNNLFSGGIRITAEDPVVQENRADLVTAIGFEGDNRSGLRLQLGATGTSSITVTVLDSNNNYVPVPNAEVTLIKSGQAFDFGSTDRNGVVIFDQVPVSDGGSQAHYAVHATSKVVGRAGSSGDIVLTRDVPVQLSVWLNITGTVSGTVFDNDVTPAVPVLNAPVTLTMPGFYAIASTQDGGSFVFNGIPEGTFNLDAVDVDSGRHTQAFAPQTISKLFPSVTGLQLFLTRTASLTVNVYLPDDAGNSSGIFVPAANVSVTGGSYSRELQAAGGPVTFPKMFANVGYGVEVTELGGQNRFVRRSGSFPPNTYSGSIDIVLPAFGTVAAQLSGDPTQIAGASVTFSGSGKGVTVYTDSNGYAKVTGMPLGTVSVQAVSPLGLSASASVSLASQSQPVTVALTLGNFVAVDGNVDAEAGGPSVGTRVHIDVTGGSLVNALHLETRTDANGYFKFTGIPSGATINATYFGPDDASVGARVSNFAVGSATSLPRVKLDSTPPHVTAIDPANNANSVSPTSHVRITFSEAMDPASFTNKNISLIATDDGSSAPIGIPNTLVNNVLEITPQTLLKSNVVYRIVVAAALQDLAGNPMTADVTTSFTTVNYTEPKIVLMTPDVSQPLFDGQTFAAKFNKPIDLASFQPGNGGVATLQQLDALHGNPKPDGNVPLSIQLDLASSSTVDLAPVGVAIIPGAFYRLTISGVRDTQQPPNVQKAAQAYDFFAYDKIKPVVTIVSPVAAGQPLVSGAAYAPTVTIVDAGTTTASSDIHYVDWFSTDGTTKTAIARVYAAPWAVPNFVAPVTATSTTVTLYASATDLSGNSSDLASFTWDVMPNLPPQNITVTLSKQTLYLHNHVDATVAFTDEGTSCTATLAVTGKHADGTDYALPVSAIAPANVQVTRAPGAPWPAATFGVDLPADLQEGAAIQFVATVTDSDHQSASATLSSTITADATAPVILSMLPKSETSYAYNNGTTTYVISAQVQDAESGVKHVTFAWDGLAPVEATYDANGGTWSTTARVSAKNADTRVHIVATAYDYHGNQAQSTADVIYQKVNDASIPSAQWITPLDGAALPANQAVTLKLRIHATDDVRVETVTFNCPLCTTPPPVLTAPTSSGDIYEQTVTINTPAEGTPFTIAATVTDSNPDHTVNLPITIDPVAIDTSKGDAIISGDTAIENTDLTGRNLVVTGASTHAYIKVPLALKNLIVLNGATIGNPAGVKVDLTVASHLFVDGDSSINVTTKGYLGGWNANENNTEQNRNATGVTVGKTITGGAASGSSASYGGIAGQSGISGTNATYGSIAAPSDFGSGGGGSATCCTAGGNGGGAVSLRTTSTAGDLGRFVVAGGIRADGQNGAGQWGSGSGGSIVLSSHALVTGHATRITANGGDDSGANDGSGGAGGGRIAVTATDRLDLESGAPVLQARGGRNGGSNDAATYADGGAGTVFLRRPADTAGELLISAFDERYPSTTHLTHATPLASVPPVDSVAASSRALVRIDDASVNPAAVVISSGAVVLGPSDVPTISLTTTPAAGASLIQNTILTASYAAAASKALIERVDLNFTAGTTSPIAVAYLPNKSADVAITVKQDATPGNATLTATVTDRAGRSTTAAPVSFTIVANQAPALTQFDLAAPSPLYIGGRIVATLAASDDIAVKTLSLTTQIGTGTATTQLTSPNTPSATATFNVDIPQDAALENRTVTLTAKADDGLVTTTSVKTLTIAHDGVAPSVNVTQPNPSTPPYTVDSGTKIHVVATVVDNESGVHSVKASIGGSPDVDMARTANANEWAGDLATPSVPGSVTVTRTVTVTATDWATNQQTATAAVQITPHYDPAAPVVTFTCGAEGAIVAPGSSITLGVIAVPGSSGTAVTGVSFTDGPNTVPASLTNGIYSGTYTVPATATNGSTITITATATTSGQGTGTQYTQLAVMTFDRTISATTTIASNDRSYDNLNVLVTGGATTVAGTHTFKKLVVLGGTVVPQDVDILHPDTITVDTLYVACGAAVDASSYNAGVVLGFPKSTSYPGAGTASRAAGGGHMGRGGPIGWPAGGTYGSVYHPLEAGGGGEVGDSSATSAGGGVVRIVGSNVTVDGVVRGNGQDNAFWGGGAGGSVYITTGRIAGSGSIAASGGPWTVFNGNGGGGGGAVSIEYTSAGGTLLTALTAIGGNAGVSGAAGTVYTKGPQSTYGDLLVSNGSRPSLPSYVVTDLPAFGIANVLAVPSPGVATIDAMYEGPYVAGNWVRVYAPDGSTRGTWPIASVANDASARTVNGFFNIVTTPGVAYSGNLMYSATGYSAAGTTAHMLAVTYASGVWQYDNGSSFVTFTPRSDDVAFASLTKSTVAILDAQHFTSCPSAVCAPLNGLATAVFVHGTIMTNTAGDADADGVPANQRMLIRSDDDMHGIILSGGPVTVTLPSTADVRRGDVVRGVYRFDHVTVNDARVQTPDLLESTAAPSLDATSILVGGNLGAPVIDRSKVTFAPGANGPVIIGASGAVTTPNSVSVTPLELYASNAARTPSVPLFAVTAGMNVRHLSSGFSIQKNGNGNQPSSVQTASVATGYAYIQGRQNAAAARCSIAIGEFEFDLGNGAYAISIGGSSQVSGLPYTTSSLFRIEKTPATVTFVVDGKVILQRGCDSAPRVLQLGAIDDWAEWSSVNYGIDAPSSLRTANADGSFTIPIDGAAGDAIAIVARDRHTYPMQSQPLAIGTIPASVGLSGAPVLTPSSTYGGVTVTGTVSLGSPAAAGGATVALTSSSVAAPVPATITIPAGALSASFTFKTTSVASPTAATISATYGGTTVSSVLSLAHDATPPLAAITAPLPGTEIVEGTQIAVAATIVDNEVGVKQATLALDGATAAMTPDPSKPNVWNGTIAAPDIDGTVDIPKTITVTASDFDGNVSAPATVVFNEKPIIDALAPTIAWVCGGNSMYPVGASPALQVTATAAAGDTVTAVNVTITDASGAHTFPMASQGAGLWSYNGYVIPTAADATIVSIRAVATTLGNKSNGAAGSIAVVAGSNLSTFSTDATILSTDTQYENKTIVVTGGTLTIAGKHTFARLVVINTARVTQVPTDANTTYKIDVAAANVFVACGASIDAVGRGYVGQVNGVAYTYPNTTNGGSTYGAAGSHGGVGGEWESVNGVPAAAYGSLWDPNEPGGSGTVNNTGSNTSQNPGGGIIRISATTLQLDGTITADSPAGNDLSSGAGGSIRVDVTTLSGAGTIHANAGYKNAASGAGGRVAVYYAGPLGLPKANIQAYGGPSDTTSRQGATGTVFLKRADQTYGELVIDNGSVVSQRLTPLASVGTGTITAITASAGTILDTIVDANANFAGGLAGTHVYANNDKSVIWKVLSTTATSLTLDVSSTPLTAHVGQTYAGLLRFDAIRVRNSFVVAHDALESLTPIDKDNSPIVLNAAAPVVTTSKIQIVDTMSADSIVGAAGAVSDPDTPITLTVTDVRTSQTFTATAAADGSFTVPVTGNVGDTFSLVATDSSTAPLSSPPVAVTGRIINTNGVSSFTATPQSVSGGTVVDFGVRLQAVARYPVTVTITSDNGAVPVPGTEVVPIGSQTASFSVTTLTPAAQVNATITASNNINSQATVVTVIPAATGLTSLTLSTGTVQGGAAVNGTVTLASPAPASGATVALASSNPSLAGVPAVVAIPAGATAASFAVTTSQTGASVAVTITAVYGTTQSAPLNVAPCTAMQTPSAPASPGLAQTWVDDALPAGATASGTGATFSTTQAAVGTQSLYFAAGAGTRQYGFSGAPAMTVGRTDSLAAYALINPCNPPREILLDWSDGANEYRASWGEDLIEPTTNHFRMGAMPAGGQWVRLELPSLSINVTNASTATRTLTGVTIKVYDGEAWFDAIGRATCAMPPVASPSSFPQTESVWFDDQLPAGVTTFGVWTFDPSQHASGTTAQLEAYNSAFHQHWFTGATTPMRVNAGDVLFTYVLIDPCHPPQQLFLQWTTDNRNWTRAFWGDAPLYDTSGYVRMGSMPPAGQWMRLEVPAALVGLENTDVLGAAFSLVDGQAWFDRAGKYARVNVAVGKTATQSSTYQGLYPAVNAVDGITDGNYNNSPRNITHTDLNAQAWWQVDLGASYPIENIELWNRTDCCSGRLTAFWVLVSDAPFTSTDLNATKAQAGVSSYRFDNTAPPYVDFRINRTGRYVRVQLSGTDYLSLAEVQVWSPAVPQRINLAGGLSNSVAQESLLDNDQPDRAVNGNTSQNWGDSSITHTLQDLNPWWEIDLGSSQPVSSIDLWNRLDCCYAYRLQNFYVFASDSPFTSHDMATTAAQPGVYVVYYGTGVPNIPAGYTIPINHTARYIRVQLNANGTTPLSLAEVQVWSFLSTLKSLDDPAPPKSSKQ